MQRRMFLGGLTAASLGVAAGEALSPKRYEHRTQPKLEQV